MKRLKKCAMVRGVVTKTRARGCASACPGPTKPFKLPAVRLATVC
jgi:hypothetical protein